MADEFGDECHHTVKFLSCTSDVCSIQCSYSEVDTIIINRAETISGGDIKTEKDLLAENTGKE